MTKEALAELLGDVDPGYVEQAGRRKRRLFRHPRRWAAAACLVLAALAGLRCFWLSLNHDAPLVITGPDGENRIVVNQAGSLISADLDVQFEWYDKLPYGVWVQVEAAFADITGVSYEDFTARVPEDWEQAGFCARLAPEPGEAGSEDRTYVLHDYLLDYETGSGGNVTIALSAKEAPLRDCFLSCEDPETSEIGGVSLTIYGYEDLYLTEFFYKNLYYDVEARGISPEELESLLSGLLEADAGS